MKPEYCTTVKSKDYIVKIEVHIPITANSKQEAEDYAKSCIVNE
jgi:hypothetical protein